MLRIEHLTKTYSGKTAVSDLSLHVKPGEIFGFIGHNGAGKTTTIRAVTGVLDFDGGDIYIGGVSIKKDPVKCKSMLAYIPDNPDIYENLTGIQYLTFVCDVYGVSGTRRKELISKYAGIFEIENVLGDLISSYSHGMRQKLVVTSALIHSPKLMILDEPFVGLDPSAAHTLKLIMRELCDNGGSIFFSTHVLDVAEKLCDRIAIIKSGRLIAAGKTDEIRGDKSLEDVFLEVTNE
ncbi:ABC-type transporter ATP-binding protein EcsA [bioreactor metagenome]|uniref:ABC-type transporter ATP-binding protein EcsA n=1 Tax=bioreactor metagenome TaxID=1076179 RepID=A0A645DAV8_9ZZZZ|nr:ABC transporter ATP-binding protein [Oscillospiraceae bacterium]